VQNQLNYIYKIEVTDFKNNKVSISIPIKGEELAIVKKRESNITKDFIYANEATSITKGKFNIYIPTNSFYEDVYLDIKAKEDTLVLHKNTIPLHKSIIISTDVSNYNDEDINKLYIGRLNYKKEPYYNFTSRKGNKLTAYTKTLGSFVLVTDKSDPKIKALNFEDNKWISKNKTLKIKITDVLSGISSYKATINGKFILMEYNYKKDVLTYDFDDQIISESENNLKLIVIDNVGNNATFEATFFRK
jgi:hypothetical protein